MLCMPSDGHSEFHELGDIPAHITSSVSIVDWNRDEYLAGIESVLFNEASINRAASAATVE